VANRPQVFQDPYGLDVRNNSLFPVAIRSNENDSDAFILLPGQEYIGEQDAVYGYVATDWVDGEFVWNFGGYKTTSGVNLEINIDDFTNLSPTSSWFGDAYRGEGDGNGWKADDWFDFPYGPGQGFPHPNDMQRWVDELRNRDQCQ
jgi:hypothetical protein